MPSCVLDGFYNSKKEVFVVKERRATASSSDILFNISKCSYFCIHSKCNWIVRKRFAAGCIWSRKMRTNLATKENTY